MNTGRCCQKNCGRDGGLYVFFGGTPLALTNAEVQQRYRQRNPDRYRELQRRKPSYVPQHPFTSVDTEGWGTDSHGRQLLRMVSVGQDTLSGNPISSRDALLWLVRQSRNDRIFISFFFNYDVTQLLRDWPQEKLEFLVRDGGIKWAWNGDIGVRWRPSKMFAVKVGSTGRRITIHDTQGFFQTSLLDACRKWQVGTVEELEVLAEMKRRRGQFTDADRDHIQRYGNLEDRLLVQLMTLVRDCGNSLRIPLAPYEGAGSLAGNLLRNQSIQGYQSGVVRHRRRHGDPHPPIVLYRCQQAYAGGRFEISAHGIVGTDTRPVWEYDIQSAYPAAIRDLPCMRHGSWQNEIDLNKPGITLVRWSSRVDQVGTLMPFLFRRSTGRIYAPAAGSGWYHNIEVATALRMPNTDFDLVDGWTWNRSCSCDPWQFVSELFDLRVLLGKSSAGIFLKLGLNSLYGKFAQTVGSAPFYEPFWAGQITATTRAALLEVIIQKGADVVMCATDGIYTLSPVEGLDETPNKLGAWESKRFPDFTIVQPGFYFGTSPSGEKARVRGLAGRLTPELKAEFQEAFARDGMDGTVKVPVTTFVGIRSALNRHKLELAGRWTNEHRTIAFDCSSKRIPLDQFEPPGRSYCRSWPWPGRIDAESAAYSKGVSDHVYADGIANRIIEDEQYEPADYHT